MSSNKKSAPPQAPQGSGNRPDQGSWPWPTEGGSYVRDPDSGALTKREEASSGSA